MKKQPKAKKVRPVDNLDRPSAMESLGYRVGTSITKKQFKALPSLIPLLGEKDSKILNRILVDELDEANQYSSSSGESA